MLFGLVLLGGIFGPCLITVPTTRPACHSSLVLCLPSLGESLPSVPNAYEHPATVAVSDVHGAKTRVYIPAHGRSEAQNGLSDLILSSEPKPLVHHRPPPPQSVWSPDGLSYPL
uniref:Uncharacterized protein n=1 Tax=Tanacetum cinerariifolium TaxID=118510 RepID=A0A699Q0N5_TANCI|nr:hypothetical protein [Tanacetum cinerariifolium]